MFLEMHYKNILKEQYFSLFSIWKDTQCTINSNYLLETRLHSCRYTDPFIADI